MTNEQLIDFTMKLHDNLILKQTELINDNKEFQEKLNLIEAKSNSGFNNVITSKRII